MIGRGLAVVISVQILNCVGINKRANSCNYDPSASCECWIPFIGTENFFLGDPEHNCKRAKACYVKNSSGCSDIKQARGGGRCQSKLACNVGPTTTPPPPPVLEPKCPGTPDENNYCS